VSRLTLQVLEQKYAICRLEQGAPIPSWAFSGEFVSITATSDELSVVCLEEAVPPGVCCEKSWRCLKVAGPLDFSLSGILASLTAPLAAAEIPLFAVSTYHTDYLLVKELDLNRAIAVLLEAGHVFSK
jgi:uncharacterized protein